jgi:hypothetical protein
MGTVIDGTGDAELEATVFGKEPQWGIQRVLGRIEEHRVSGRAVVFPDEEHDEQMRILAQEPGVVRVVIQGQAERLKRLVEETRRVWPRQTL